MEKKRSRIIIPDSDINYDVPSRKLRFLGGIRLAKGARVCLGVRLPDTWQSSCALELEVVLYDPRTNQELNIVMDKMVEFSQIPHEVVIPLYMATELDGALRRVLASMARYINFSLSGSDKIEVEIALPIGPSGKGTEIYYGKIDQNDAGGLLIIGKTAE